MFLVNSHPGLFSVAFFSLFPKEKTYLRHPFFRSYGVILPNSLTRVISRTFGYSPHLPVSVCGTVTLTSNYEVFLGSSFRVSLCPRDSYSHLEGNGPADLPANPFYLLKPPSVRWLTFHLCVTPSLRQSKGGTGIFNPFTITYAFRPQLRNRLTLSRLTLLRKP